MKRVFQIFISGLVLSVSLGAAFGDSAASIHVNSGSWWILPDSGSAWGHSSTWASKAKIIWDSGPYEVDGTVHGVKTRLESKFEKLKARTFDGYDDTKIGDLKSGAWSKGTGKSWVGMITYGADWELQGSGWLGSEPGEPSWDTQAYAYDPWYIMPEYLADIAGDTFGLYIPFGLEEGSYSGSSVLSDSAGISLTVAYETAAEYIVLLDILATTESISVVGGDLASSVSFYALEGMDVEPTTDPVHELTCGDIAASLETDLLSDNYLDQPFYLGAYLQDIPVPTALMADDAVASIHVIAGIYAADAVPEPTALILLAAGNLALLCRRKS